MEFDQSYNGAPGDWNFPSPNSTPTHGSSGSNIFQTPKTSSFPTHFQDAFLTPQMHGYTTPQQPQYQSMTPVQGPQSSSDTLRSNYYANQQASGGQRAVQNMMPPGSRDHGMAVISPTYGNLDSALMQLPANDSFGSTQMQTPPPTRGASNKKSQYSQEIAFGTPSTIASRRYMTPQHSNAPLHNPSFTQHTPVHFPYLEFSPDMHQFTNLGPASAPVMPQSRVFWGQTGSPVHTVSQPTLDDPFAPTVTSASWLSTVSPHDDHRRVAFDTPVMHSFPVQVPTARPLARRMTDNYGSTVGNEVTSAVVDPSLLYSGPLPPVVRTSSRSEKSKSRLSAAEQKKQANALHNRTETPSFADTMNSRSAMNLQRSKTAAPGKLKSVFESLSGTDSISRSSSLKQVPRTASPVKRIGRPSVGSMSESKARHRTSVVLKIDENGIARTETTRVEESPTRSIKERYPALFDSDSSDAESNASECLPSRPSSFVFDKRDERKSKAARLDPPVENLEGLSIPRSSSAHSMKKGIPPSRAVVAATAQLRLNGSFRRSTPSRNSRRAASSSTTALIDTCPMDVRAEQAQSVTGAEQSHYYPPHTQSNSIDWADRGDSFDALPTGTETALDVHNRRWSIMSFEQQQQQVRPLVMASQQPYYHQPVFSSPPMPPPQTRPVQIRCQCGWSDDRGQALVQCVSCTQWAHSGCVGLDGLSSPSSFTCFLCTKPSPSRSFSGRTNVSGR